MSEIQQELFEKQLHSIAQHLDYPSTPPVAASVMSRLRPITGSRRISRRLAWSLTVLLVVFTSLMLIPPARAAILDFIQIGIVRIFRAEPTPALPPNQEAPSTKVRTTATPVPTSQPLIPILEKLAGEMTLEEGQNAGRSPILFPS